ncbi:transmembrane protein, putative (macronuclear) [Tetrahymena thermophila SB210]|uniref:Transmembrane protein, putative n=1 Tax=Tetrahymena thermophila (strain SB210) TaxID=312017 RepID=W7XJX1_TETTS|nr:transmembrane protein, putative [Tetrahymena thermophila SB210]EWS76021.1 transmembrane protein, putative [Tetrahymena thermophila SB210]|eukprot:XP_012651459.1 transmembrane protein, putative [Tetrahymena thermophila SB210]
MSPIQFFNSKPQVSVLIYLFNLLFKLFQFPKYFYHYLLKRNLFFLNLLIFIFLKLLGFRNRFQIFKLLFRSFFKEVNYFHLFFKQLIRVRLNTFPFFIKYQGLTLIIQISVVLFLIYLYRFLRYLICSFQFFQFNLTFFLFDHQFFQQLKLKNLQSRNQCAQQFHQNCFIQQSRH